jgi:hypothetical protein
VLAVRSPQTVRRLDKRKENKYEVCVDNQYYCIPNYESPMAFTNFSVSRNLRLSKFGEL